MAQVAMMPRAGEQVMVAWGELRWCCAFAIVQAHLLRRFMQVTSMAHKVAPAFAPEAAQAAAEAPAAVHGAPENAQVYMHPYTRRISYCSMTCSECHSTVMVSMECAVDADFCARRLPGSLTESGIASTLQQSRELLERLKRMDAFDTQNFDCAVSS
jgi:hypothetical protein